MKQKLFDHLERIQKGVQQLEKDLPRVMGVTAVEFFQLNFEKEGLIRNGGLSKWKGRIDGTPRNSRKVLSDTNTLSDSIRYKVGGKDWVSVGVDLDKVPYAQIHNEGGTITVTPAMRRFFWAQHKETGEEFWKWLALTKKTSFTIPKREFMAVTPDIEKAFERDITSRMDDIFESR